MRVPLGYRSGPVLLPSFPLTAVPTPGHQRLSGELHEGSGYRTLPNGCDPQSGRRALFDAASCDASDAASCARRADVRLSVVEPECLSRARAGALSSLHRPLLFVPRHLPKHPLIPRADHKRFLHPPLLILSRRLGPEVDLLAHPLLYLSKFR